VSSGAWNTFSDAGGNLVGTAVLIKTSLKKASDTVDWVYMPTRVDLLLAAPNPASSDQLQPTSFFVTLYDDDNSTGTHTPGIPTHDTLSDNRQRASTPIKQGPVVPARHLDGGLAQSARHDLLLGCTHPAAPVTMANGQYNGVVWVALRRHDSEREPDRPVHWRHQRLQGAPARVTAQRS